MARLERFLDALGRACTGTGRVYLTGGATALLKGWRASTVDVDLRLDPEPPAAFEAIARLKNSLQINVELASPPDFLPELPGWRDRSEWFARHGQVDFYHFDIASQCLAKLERGHSRDISDVAAMLDLGLVERAQLRTMLDAIEPALIRYPAVDGVAFRAAVEQAIGDHDG